MGLFNFGKKNEGGLMDTIRCDAKDALIWKWRPDGEGALTTRKANAIRWGSGLVVRPGQAAVFIYTQDGVGQCDVIVGPYNGPVKTDNLPVIANILGAAYDGKTPFQAEIYFVAISAIMNLDFTISWFTIQSPQPEYNSYNIDIAVDGTFMFSVSPPRDTLRFMYEQSGRTDISFDEFRLARVKEDVMGVYEAMEGNDTTLEEFQEKIKPMVITGVKDSLSNLPDNIFVLHLNKLIEQASQWIMFANKNRRPSLAQRLHTNFYIWASEFNLTDIRYNEEKDHYQKLLRITTDQNFAFNLQNEANALAKLVTDTNVRNAMVTEQARIQLEHQEDMLGRMREEAQYAQHAQTDSTAYRTDLSSQTANIGAHTVNVQGSVMQTGMESLGNMSQMNFGNGGGGMNPAGMMMGMGMASGMAGQMGQMMGNMGNAFSNQVAMGGAPTPPPMPGQTPPAPPTQPGMAFFVLVNGQQMGPCDMNTLRQMMPAGQFTAQTMVWANGMPQWAAAGTVPALAPLFQAAPTPPAPPTPGSVPPPPPTM